MPPKTAAKPAPSHPPYVEMIKAAISSLKERTGSSVQAITKYVEANYKLPDNFKKVLSNQLKKLAAEGKLVKVKASYKLGDALKKAPKKPKAKKAKAAKKPAAKKPKKAAKKPAAKKPKAKKPKAAKK